VKDDDQMYGPHSPKAIELCPKDSFGDWWSSVLKRLTKTVIHRDIENKKPPDLTGGLS